MDEARFGTHSKIGHGWFESGKRSPTPVKLGFKNFYVYSAVEPATGEVFSLVLPRVTTEMMALFLRELGKAFPEDQLIVVMDGAGWHRSKSLQLPATIQPLILPPYCPELNPVERLWLQVKRETIRNKVYDSLADLEGAVCSFLASLSTASVAQLCSVNWFN